MRALEGMMDTQALLTLWDNALQAPAWNHAPVWFHGDLLSGNVLLRDGTISAIIDFSLLGVGDPACDLMIAWNLFNRDSRTVFRQALDVDDATWERGKGQALAQAVIFIPYYLHTNPAGVRSARRSLDALLKELYS